MFKLRIPVAIVFAAVLVFTSASCRSRAPVHTTDDQKPIKYRVLHDVEKHIEGDVTYDRVPIYTRNLSDSTAIFFGRISYGDSKQFYILIELSGQDWKFFPGDITIKADQLIMKFKDPKPFRKVKKGQKYSTCHEMVRVNLDDQSAFFIGYAKELAIEYGDGPVSISPKFISIKTDFFGDYKE